jgi:hypothetical protein
MERRNFIYLWLMVLMVLCFAIPSARAQILAEVTDNTCTVWTGAECTGYSGQGCNSTTFTLTSAKTVKLCASINCDNGQNCPYCLSVAYIYPVTGSNYVCYHSLCDERCTGYCHDVSLPAGDYILYSCKLDCNNISCDNCPTTCTAKATVYDFPEP